MARIVLDLPKLRANGRFRALVKKCIDEDQAVGMLARFYESAQDHWAHDNLMSREEFDLGGLTPILEVGLAVEKDGGIYARGGAERFDWLKKRVTAGKKGGSKRQANESKPQANESKDEATASKPQANDVFCNPTSTSTSLTNSSTEKISNSLTLKGGIKTPHPTVTPNVALIAMEKKLKRDATRLKTEIVSAFRECAGDADEHQSKAIDRMGKETWWIVERKWGKWSSFCKEYYREHTAGRGQRFEDALTATIESYLPSIWGGEYAI